MKTSKKCRTFPEPLDFVQFSSPSNVLKILFECAGQAKDHSTSHHQQIIYHFREKIGARDNAAAKSTKELKGIPLVMQNCQNADD